MNLCSEDHDEVCYESRNCPCCVLLQEKKEIEDELVQLREEYEKLQNKENK